MCDTYNKKGRLTPRGEGADSNITEVAPNHNPALQGIRVPGQRNGFPWLASLSWLGSLGRRNAAPPKKPSWPGLGVT